MVIHTADSARKYSSDLGKVISMSGQQNLGVHSPAKNTIIRVTDLQVIICLPGPRPADFVAVEHGDFVGDEGNETPNFSREERPTWMLEVSDVSACKPYGTYGHEEVATQSANLTSMSFKTGVSSSSLAPAKRIERSNIKASTTEQRELTAGSIPNADKYLGSPCHSTPMPPTALSMPGTGRSAAEDVPFPDHCTRVSRWAFADSSDGEADDSGGGDSNISSFSEAEDRKALRTRRPGVHRLRRRIGQLTLMDEPAFLPTKSRPSRLFPTRTDLEQRVNIERNQQQALSPSAVPPSTTSCSHVTTSPDDVNYVINDEDLSDTSVSQSALEEAYLSDLGRKGKPQDRK